MTGRRLPDVTPLQYAHLEALSCGERTGAQMRTRLVLHGAITSRAGFYKVMERLMELSLVTSRTVGRDGGKSPGAECCYALTEAGQNAVAATLRFYGVAGKSKREVQERHELHTRHSQHLWTRRGSRRSAASAGAGRSEVQ